MSVVKKKLWIRRLPVFHSFSLTTSARQRRAVKTKKKIKSNIILPVKEVYNETEHESLKDEDKNSSQNESSIEIARDVSKSPGSKYERISLVSLIGKQCPESKENKIECNQYVEAKNSTLCEGNALNINEMPSPVDLSAISGSQVSKIPIELTPVGRKRPELISQPPKPVKKAHFFSRRLGYDTSNRKIHSKAIVLVEKMMLNDFCTPLKVKEEPESSPNKLTSHVAHDKDLPPESNVYLKSRAIGSGVRKTLLKERSYEDKRQCSKMTSTPVKKDYSNISSPNISEIKSGSDGSYLLPKLSHVMISDSCPSYETPKSPERSVEINAEKSTDVDNNGICCISTLHDFPILPCHIPTRKVFNTPPFFDYEEDILSIQF